MKKAYICPAVRVMALESTALLTESIPVGVKQTGEVVFQSKEFDMDEDFEE